MKAAAILLAVLVVAGAAMMLWPDDEYQWAVDGDKPLPAVPIENAMSDVKVELGRWLFYDTRLSVTETMSCATCHIQALAFTDGRPRSVGATGAVHPRGAMSLVNAAYASRLTWANHLITTLEDQALIPLLGDDPVEMGMGDRQEAIADLLRTDERYSGWMQEAFPNDEDPYSTLNAIRAIAAFTRTIISYDSPYDRYLAGDDAALGDSAIRGMDLFFSERLECFHCHGGFNFTDSSTHANAVVERFGYHNTGLYNIDGAGAYPADNTGLFDMTGQRRDMGRFKAPTLRNIAVTAPYMHDGSIPDLDGVIDHYARGGRLIEEGPYAGDGRRNPFKSLFVRGFDLSEAERADLVAFLESLTDETVLTHSRWSDPYREVDAAAAPATP